MDMLQEMRLATSYDYTMQNETFPLLLGFYKSMVIEKIQTRVL